MHLNAEGASPVPGQPARTGQRSRLSWVRALPMLAKPIAQTMSWGALITGCLAGTVILALLAYVAETSRWPLDQGTVRVAFLPAVAALAFVPRAPFRPLSQATPVPAWVAPSGQLLLAAPVLGATGWAQLRVMTHTMPPHTVPAAVYPLIAQLTGWCAVTVAAAACTGRSRNADHGGAHAAPVSLPIIALAWYAPMTHRFLAGPAATAHTVTIAWYAIAAAAAAVTCAAMRDQWHRYSGTLHRLAFPEPRHSGRGGRAS